MPSGEHLKGKSPHGFGSHPENINRNGRPKALRNVIKDLFIEEFNVQLSSSQANEMIMAMLCMTERQVSELGERDDVPFWLKMKRACWRASSACFLVVAIILIA